MNRWSKIRALVRIAPREPREALARVAHVVEHHWDRFSAPAGDYTVVTADTAHARIRDCLAVGGAWDGFEAELLEVDARMSGRLARLPGDQPIAFAHCATRALARCCYLACRALAPAVVVETGVAYGMTSAYVLSALEANARGSLHSVDLPPLGDERGRFVGSLVPEALKRRWTLHRGASRTTLPGVLERASRVDLFVHDSLHTYRTMRWEFEAAWPHLPAGGMLLSDDIGENAAFEHFGRRARPRVHLAVGDDERRPSFGVAIKS